MKQYSGAVLFVDMLGIGALTQGQIHLTKAECDSWHVKEEATSSHQLLGAKLLLQFRKSLRHTRDSFNDVKVAQLSDSAFLWSSDPFAVINAAREFMWHSLSAGLLCRAGLAYGQIIEPNKVNKSLGQFILGDAVTNAVGFEGRGKGARIFCDNEIAQQIYSKSRFQSEPFAPLRNPLDGSIVDEYRWYLFPKAIERKKSIIKNPRQTVVGLINLLAILRHSPQLNWNARSSAGRLQIACTIEAISKMIENFIPTKNYAFSVEHLLAVEDAKRSVEQMDRIRNTYLQEISIFFPDD
jgi:hypothetical protein